MKKWVVLDKQVGETPLACAETWRAAQLAQPTAPPALQNAPLAYAGRLDPMASGKLLVLIGDECKNQTNYHGLDKAYDFSVLLGIGSDTHDVLGRLQADDSAWETTEIHSPKPSPQGAFFEESSLRSALERTSSELTGNIELPYPHFSAKTVAGKPLHMWTLEERLDEIEIPTKTSTIYKLDLAQLETKTREQVCDEARAKIDTIPPVTEVRKALGNDFRRADVRADWERIKADDTLPNEYTIAQFHCVASSGTYMRTLAHVIATNLGQPGLAWHIHRTHIGTYDPANQNWSKEF